MPTFASTAKSNSAKNEMLGKYYFEFDAELSSLSKIIDKYSVYLPDAVLVKSNGVFMESMSLNHDSKPEQFMHCFRTVNIFQNALRKLIGTEEVSLDLYEVFSTTKMKLNKRVKEE